MSDSNKPAKVPTPSDNVRKAAEEILRCSTGWLVPASQSIENDAARKMVEEMISRHCHVTEMEAVIEKAREALRWCKDTISLPGSNAHSVINQALSAIDALKGDK